MPLTLDNKTKEEKVDEIKNAIETGDSSTFAEAVVQNIIANNEEIQNKLISEAKTFNVQNADQDILMKRGFVPLTAEEIKYYNEVKDKHSFSGLELPKTVFERVFDDLRKNHPLLSKINFQNVTGVTEWLIRVDDVEAAWWGPLCEEIKKKLDTGFKTVNTSLYKVSAYVPVCKAMLDLGPQWLDRYVREILAEAISMAMEQAIIAGTGKDQPVGVIKKLEDVQDGEHKDKDAVVLADFSPVTIGTKILAPLSKGKTTPLGEILIIVNEQTYYEKFYAIENVQDRDGLYHKQNLPFNGTVIPSPYVPVGKMVAGEARNYFMGIGSNLKIEYSDEFRFLDDQRVYIAKQYANGRPRKDEDFIVFDVSNMTLKAAEVTPGA